MRWKLKDLLVECAPPHSGKECALRTFVMRKPQDLAQVEKTQNKTNPLPSKNAATKSTKILQQNKNC